MLFQITAAGRALIAANPTGVPITRSDFGAAFNYVPANEPTGLQGALVYTTNAIFNASIANLNTLRYSVFVPGPVGPWVFGEIALYSGATLFGVGASVVPISKQVNDVDNQLRVDIFIDTANGSRFNSFEVVSSATRDFFPRVHSVDDLISPHYDGNNAYVVYGDSQPGEGFLAYSDPSGIWTFSNKPHTWFTGKVDSVGPQGLQSDDLLGATYNGTITDLVIQFINGPQRGFCRKITQLTTAGGVVWNSSMLEFPDIGDDFIIVGPSAAVGFTGLHNTLDGLQGGSLNERYHLTNLEHEGVLYPRLKMRTAATPVDQLLATDDDTYIEITDDCVFSVGNPATATYPLGGLSILRLIGPCTVTLQGIGGSVISPQNSVVVTLNSGEVMSFGLVRKATTAWDLIAPADGSIIGGGGGNVNHSFTNSRANAYYLPRYSALGVATGPTAELELSRLSITDLGVRLYPGDQTVAEVWTAPALMVWPTPVGTIGTTPTGLPNAATAYTLTLVINGTNYTLSITGSSAQTMAAMVTALNASAATVVGAAASVAFALVRGKITITVTSATVPTTLALGVPTSLSSVVTSLAKLVGVQSSSQVNAVSDNAIVLDVFDGTSNQVRVVDPGNVAIGRRSRVSGISSIVVGGDYSEVQGDRSSVMNSDGGRVVANDSHIIGGARAYIGVAPGETATAPSHAVIAGSTNARIMSTAAGGAANGSVAVGGQEVTITSRSVAAVGSSSAVISGDQAVALASEGVQLDGDRSVSIASSNLSLPGAGSVALATDTLTNATGKGLVVVGSKNINLAGAEDLVVFNNHDLTITQRSALVYPSTAAYGVSFTATFQASGSGAELHLTTDGAVGSSVNGMDVDSCWCIRGQVAANSATDFKAWSIDAMLYPAGGSEGSIAVMGMRIEELGATTNAVNWELDIVNLLADTSIMHVVINTAGNPAGFDTVNASAVIHVTRAKPVV